MHRARSLPKLVVPMWVGLVVASTLGAAGCGRSVHLGQLGDGGGGPPDTGNGSPDATDGGSNVLWQATFEPGDLSEWMADGNGGAYVVGAGVAPAVTTAFAHRGSYAGIAAVMPTASVVADSYWFRTQPSPDAAYYSAWYFISGSIQVQSWLSLIHLRVSTSGDGHNLVPVWDFNANQRPDGSLVPHLYNFLMKVNFEQQTLAAWPRATWFHLEMYLRKSPTNGQITIWQDDVQVLNVTGVPTASTDWIEWAVGNASDGISPSPAIVYVDDAAISLTRLGDQP